MLADGTMTLQKAAQLLKVSPKTIQRDLVEIRPDVREVEGLLETYKASIRKRLPIDERVALYVENARQNTNPFARQKALERLDDLDGVVSEGERLRIPRDREQAQPGPMFILPAGARVDILVTQQYNTIRPASETAPLDREKSPIKPE
jgi:hypothetical protein